MDPTLQPHADHFEYRYKQYLDIKGRIEQAEGSLENFAKVNCKSEPQSQLHFNAAQCPRRKYQYRV